VIKYSEIWLRYFKTSFKGKRLNHRDIRLMKEKTDAVARWMDILIIWIQAMLIFIALATFEMTHN
jgi:hypothetical protein